MNNYRKGKNIEEPLDKNKIPIPGLPDNFLWMQVRGGSKIRNLLSHALEEFPQKKHVLWTGFGPSVGKAVTCAEIMKKEWDNSLHQITKLCYRLIEEYWDPLLPELDQLVVKRKLPMIHIYLSMEPLNKDELGYQAPGETTPYKLNESHFQERRGPSVNKITDKRGHTLGEFMSHKLPESTSNKAFKYKNKEKTLVPENINEQLNVNLSEDAGGPIKSSESSRTSNNNKSSLQSNSERSQEQERIKVISNQPNSKKKKKQKFQGNSSTRQSKNSGNSKMSDNVNFKTSPR